MNNQNYFDKPRMALEMNIILDQRNLFKNKNYFEQTESFSVT